MTMRVLDKYLQTNEQGRKVLLINIELPLDENDKFNMTNQDFMTAFYDALVEFEDQQKDADK